MIIKGGLESTALVAVSEVVLVNAASNIQRNDVQLS